jgi:hypothetical protein
MPDRLEWFSNSFRRGKASRAAQFVDGDFQSAGENSIDELGVRAACRMRGA